MTDGLFFQEYKSHSWPSRCTDRLLDGLRGSVVATTERSD